MGRRFLAYPYHLWTLLFTVIPLALIVYFAFTDRYTAGFTLDNLRQAAQPVYLGVLWHSVWLAGVSTFLCFLVGYPMAMILAKSGVRYRRMLAMLIVVPMWMNFLLRTYAWMTLLEKNGAVNALLSFLGLPSIHILYTDTAVLLGMVYNFLPFMILPIYSVLMKMDKSLLEAAEDLGADAWTAFRRVTFPLSLPGVYAGTLMVFMPAVTTFAISRLLGSGNFMMFGDLIDKQFLESNNWHFGSSLSLVMMVLIIISISLLNKADPKGEGSAM